jgi:hypothetical protein
MTARNLPGGPPTDLNRVPATPPDDGSGTDRPLGDFLTGIFDVLSNQLTPSGQREDIEMLMPGANDPLEGLVPDEFRPFMSTFDWFDPTVWAGAAPGDISRIDLTAIPETTGPGAQGTGLDWFRSGEAPNNFTNRNNPLYTSRKDFVVALAPQLEALFGVSSGGVGYYRPPSASDVAPGGKSANSDHYSAGALDIYGTPQELTALRNWLIEQPFTAFVRYQSESHTKHLHLSIDIGWVANNYFSGTQLPPLTVAPPPSVEAGRLTGEPPQTTSKPPEPEVVTPVTGGPR